MALGAGFEADTIDVQAQAAVRRRHHGKCDSVPSRRPGLAVLRRCRSEPSWDPEYPPDVQNRFIAAERAHAVAISFHRGHRIVAAQLGGDWTGTVHAPGNNAIVDNLEGVSSQEVMIRGVEAINRLLAAGVG